jgi:hypothetical protein
MLTPYATGAAASDSLLSSPFPHDLAANGMNALIRLIIFIVPVTAMGCAHRPSPSHLEKLPEEVVADFTIAIQDGDRKAIEELVIPGADIDKYVALALESVESVRQLNAAAKEEFKRSDDIEPPPNPHELVERSLFKSRVEGRRAWVTIEDHSSPMTELAHGRGGWRIVAVYGFSEPSLKGMNEAFKDVKEHVVAHRYATWEEAKRDLEVRMTKTPDVDNKSAEN